MDTETLDVFERPRTTWTPSMDRFFIDLMLEHVRRGNMVDYAFRKQVWVQMNALFNQKFGIQYEKDVLKNRYKSLRRKYNEITTILSHDGFSWDGKRQMLIAADKVWEDYIKDHPDKRSYRTKVLPYYTDLCKIYGSTPVNGTSNHMAHSVGINGDSSRTKSADTLGEADASGDLQSPHTATALKHPVDSPHCSSHSGEKLAEKSTEAGVLNAPCEVAYTTQLKKDEDERYAFLKKDEDGLYPVEVVFAIDAVPGMLPTSIYNPSRITWSPSMDHFFTHLMLEQVLKGNKIGPSFNEEAWIHMTSLFSEKFGSRFNKDVLIDRFKTLWREYCLIKCLLGDDGFHWDEELHMVTADIHVWDIYTKVNPDVQKYRFKRIPYFHDLCLIYGTTTPDRTDDYSDHTGSIKDFIQVTVNGGTIHGLQSPSSPFADRNLISNGQDEVPYFVADMEVSNDLNKRLELAPSASEQTKKARKDTEGMMDAIHQMATAVTSLADTKKEDSNSTSIVSAVHALQAVPDLDEDLILDACDYLEDEKKAKTFLALDVRLRKKWLMRKLRPVA